MAATVGKFSSKMKIYRPLLQGVFPACKPEGLNHIDFLDQVRLRIEFEVGFRLSRAGIQCNAFPRLRKKETGLVNVALGSYVAHLANFKYSTIKSKLTVKLGERAYWAIFSPERQKRLGIVDDMEPCKSFDHVTPEKVKAVLDCFRGENLYFRAPKERDIRELVTERNSEKLARHGSQIFKGASVPYPATIHSVDRVDCSQLPIISVDLTTCGSFCREYFAFNLGLKLDTYAHLVSAFIYKVDEICIDEALQLYDIEWKRIDWAMKKNLSRYSRMCQELESLGRPVRERYRSPW